MKATVKVLGGLEITVEFKPCRAEPDVGLMSDYVDEWEIVEIAGRPLRKKESAAWLYNRIEARKGEEDRVLQACYDRMADEAQYYEEPDDY